MRAIRVFEGADEKLATCEGWKEPRDKVIAAFCGQQDPTTVKFSVLAHAIAARDTRLRRHALELFERKITGKDSVEAESQRLFGAQALRLLPKLPGLATKKLLRRLNQRDLATSDLLETVPEHAEIRAHLEQ